MAGSYNYNPNFTPVPMQQGDTFQPTGGTVPFGQAVQTLFPGTGVGATSMGTTGGVPTAYYDASVPNAYTTLQGGINAGYNFSPYNGTYVLTGDKEYAAMQDGADSYDKLTGQNLTAAQYDQMINPTTYGARWNADGSQVTGQQTVSDPNTILGTPGVPLYDPRSGQIVTGSTAGAPTGFGASGLGSGTGSSQTGGAQGTTGNGIAGLYQSLLGRAPDAGGLQFYSNELANGTSLQDIAADIQKSPEYLASHGGTGTTNGGGLLAGAGGGSSMGGGYGVSSNPYQGGQADAIRTQTQDFLNDALNQIRSGAVATGGLGGTREGVAQGIALSKGADYLSGNLANLYGSNWNSDQNRALQQYGMDQNFYTAQRGQDQSGAALGAQLYGLGQNGQWSNLTNYGNLLSNWSGFGTTTGTNSQGGGGLGALGGALGGAQLANLWSY